MKKGSLFKSSALLGVTTLISRIMGFARDVALAAYFPKGMTDAFLVAFTIPNTLRRLFAEGALVISFVPVFTETIEKEGLGRAKILFSRAFTLLFIVLIVVVSLGVMWPQIPTAIFGYGFKPGSEKFLLTTRLTQMMFPFLFFVSMVALAMGVLNSRGHFFAPAASTIVLNIFIIIGIVMFSHYFQIPVYGVAVGVIAGGFFMLLLQIPFLKKEGFLPKIRLDLNDPALKRIGILLLPQLLGVAIYQIDITLSRLFASFLQEGSVTYLYYANRLTQLPLGVFAISIATVAFPGLSKESARDDSSGKFNLLRSALKLNFWIMLPSAVGLFVLADPIIEVIFMHGQFTESMAKYTAGCLRIYSAGLLFLSTTRLLAQDFYADKDTKTPVWCSLFALFVFICASLITMKTLSFYGLALSAVMSSISNFLLLFAIKIKRTGKEIITLDILFYLKLFFSATVMGVVVWFIYDTLSYLNSLVVLTISIVAGIFVYLTVSLFAKVEETKMVLFAIKKRFTI